MTPREALYNIVIELGPARTERNDNLSAKEARLRDSVKVLQNFIQYHPAADIPGTAEEYVHHEEGRGDGKERIEAWRRDWKTYGQ